MRRRKLLHTGLATLLILLAANLAADSLRIKYWRPDRGRWLFNLYTYQRTRSPSDILFLGSSITRFDVVARSLERQLEDAATKASVFNLGHAGSTSLENAIILRDVIGSNGCPEMIALEISAAGLNASTDQTGFVSDFAELGDLPLLAPDLLSLAGSDAFLSSRLGGLEALFYHTTRPPTARATESVLRRAGSQWHPQRFKKDKRTDQRFLRAVQRFRMRRFLTDFEIGGTSVRGLKAILRMASGCESGLLLLRYPTLLPLDTEELQRIERELEDYIRAFSRRAGVPLYEIDAEAAGLASRHYQDFIHLNHTGAMRLTTFLAAEIIGPQLRAARAPRS